MDIYIDSDCRCHTADDGTRKRVQTAFFDGKCDAYIEGYRFVPEGESWTREDGEVFSGEMIAPFRDHGELDECQRAFEHAQMADMRAALELLGVSADE